MNIFSDNSQSIGNTPLVRLKHFGQGNIIAKLESRNPAMSVKCRIGANMIWQAEKDGKLKKGMTIVEPTSGNTGIALAFVGSSWATKVKLTVHQHESGASQGVKALGAELVDACQGHERCGRCRSGTGSVRPGAIYLLQQFENPANPAIHEKTTGPEI